MFTTIRLVITPFTAHNDHSVVTVRTLKLYSHGNFQVYNTVPLTVVSVLYSRSPELTHHN